MWQDFVFTGASVAVSYALIPQVYHGYKNKVKTITKQTGIITAVGLMTMSGAYYSLDLDFSTITTVAAATLWGTLTFQSFKYKDVKGGLEQKIDPNPISK